MSADEEQTPIFIIGCERSGTTLLHAMLGSHTNISAPEVTWFYPRFYPYLHTYGDLADDVNFRTLVDEMYFSLFHLGLNINPIAAVDIILEKAKERTFESVVTAILDLYTEQQNKKRWIDKTPHNLFFIDEIKQAFPGAKFIHLLRDGRDVAVALMRSKFGPKNILTATESWKRCFNEMDLQKDSLSASEFIEIRYEELVTKPEQTLKCLCEFVNEDYQDGLLQFYQSDFARKRGIRRDHVNIGKPVSDKFVGYFHYYLSQYEQEVFNYVAGDELAKAGYVSTSASCELTSLEIELMREQDSQIRVAIQGSRGASSIEESYKEWLRDQREYRKTLGIWSDQDIPADSIIGRIEEDFLMGVRVSRRIKDQYAIQRRYSKRTSHNL